MIRYLLVSALALMLTVVHAATGSPFCVRALAPANDNNVPLKQNDKYLDWQGGAFLNLGIEYMRGLEHMGVVAPQDYAVASSGVYAVTNEFTTTVASVSGDRRETNLLVGSPYQVTRDGSFIISGENARTIINVYDLKNKGTILTDRQNNNRRVPNIVLSLQASDRVYGLNTALSGDPQSTKEYLTVVDQGLSLVEIYELEPGHSPRLFSRQDFSNYVSPENMSYAIFIPQRSQLVLNFSDLGVSNFPKLFNFKNGKFIPGPILENPPPMAGIARPKSMQVRYFQRGAVSPSGRYIFVGRKDIDGAIDVFSAFSGKFIRRLQITLPISVNSEFAISQNEKFFAINSFESRIFVFDLETPSNSAIGCLYGPSGYITSLAFSDDGSSLLSAGVHGNVIKWDLSRLTSH